MATYYYIGGATGAMRTASDWSTTSGGSALSSITWCSGDTMVVDSDAVITSDLVVASTTNATSGLLVTGSGSPVIVYTYNADGSPTLGTAESPFILPDCLVSIKLSSENKSTWTLHLKCNTNTKIKELYLDCALHFYADSLDTIPVMGNIYTHSSIGGCALEFHNVSAFRLMGEGDQFIYNFNPAPGWGLDADTPVLLDKTLGSVTLIQYSGALGVANTAHDPMVVSGACPTIIVDDIAAANAALGTSWTAMSYGPIRLNGNLTCESLTLANGVDATYPTRVQIPQGMTLSSGSTTWGTNCVIESPGFADIVFDLTGSGITLQNYTTISPAKTLSEKNGTHTLSLQTSYLGTSSSDFATTLYDGTESLYTYSESDMSGVSTSGNVVTIPWTGGALVLDFDANEAKLTAPISTFAGTYATTCTDTSNQDDADDTNYNVADAVSKACLVAPEGESEWVTIAAFHGFEEAFGDWTRLGAFACSVPAVIEDGEPK